MANPIDITVTQQALKELDTLILKVTTAREGFLSLGQQALDSSKNVAKIGTPSGLSNNTALNAQINADIKKQAQEVEKLHAVIAKKAETSRLAEIRLQQAREKSFDSFEKNARKEQAIIEKNNNVYNKTQAQINRLTVAYNDLAVRKARYNNLNENEEKRLVTLTSINEKYNGVLKQTDATIGRNGRNVGNYASGYNALGNSINQLSREAPAFANSVNTGFMALSNNIPALFDAIGGIRNQNKALAAEGKPTVSVLKQLAGALFSWQTLLSVGVTLLTLYGGKIVEFIGNSLKAKNAISSLAENQQLLNDTLKESSGSYAEEKVNIEVLYQTATNLNASYKDRKRAVDELQELYPFYFKSLTDEEIMVGKAKDQYNLLSQAIVTTAKARASEGILQKRESERLVIEQKDIETITGKYKELARTKNEKTTSASVGVGGVSTVLGKETIRRDIQKLREESLLQREQWAKEDAFFIKKIAEGNAIEQTLKPAEKAHKEKIKKEKQFRREDVEGIQVHIKNVGILVTEINEEIARLETEKIVANAEELPAVNFQLKQLLELKKQLNEVPNADFKINTPVSKDDIDKVDEMTTGIRNYLKSFSSEFMSNSGFSETFSLLSKEIEGFGKNFAVTFNAIAESAQEAFNFISGASEKNFDNERKRIEDQQAIAISYAGGSAVAIDKINQDAEKRKKDIANRENKAKQKQAMFNIAIDTAQAVVAALPNIPLSIAIGVLGAVQIGIVAAQKVPQYFDGTDNHPGGAMLINDSKGSNYKEKVILPSGEVILPQGRNVLMNAPKGTKVLTHEQQLMEMMQDNGISMSNTINKSNGMTAYEMDSVLGKHFGNMKTVNNYVDQKGFHSYIQNGNSRTILTGNRVSGTGISV